MIIKTDYSRLSDLSAKLKRLENDITEITLRVTKMANTTAQTTKYQNTEWEIKRACDSITNAVNNTNKRMRIVCEKLNSQSSIVRGAISYYRDADKIEKINKGNILLKVGPNLAGIFGSVAVKRSYLGNLSSIIINGTKSVANLIENTAEIIETGAEVHGKAVGALVNYVAKGKHVIVSGGAVGRALTGVKGTRYLSNNFEKMTGIARTAKLAKGAKIVGVAASVVAGAATVADGILKNIKSNASIQKTTADAVVETGYQVTKYIVAAKVGAAAGAVGGPVGVVVGAVAGVAVGAVLDVVSEAKIIGGQSIKEVVSAQIQTGINSAINVGTNVAKGAARVADSLFKSIKLPKFGFG